jgi:pyruvate-formate lyase
MARRVELAKREMEKEREKALEEERKREVSLNQQKIQPHISMDYKVLLIKAIRDKISRKQYFS